jgi:hypothetical protein
MGFLFFLCLLLSACSTYQTLTPGIYYKRDIEVTINSKVYEGVVVVPHAAQYEFKFSPKGDMDMIIIRSCQRTYAAEKQSGGFLGIGKRKEFTYIYSPQFPIESDRVCPLRADAYESGSEARHSWSFVDFESPNWQIKYRLKCSDKVIDVNGVGVCQEMIDTTQRVEFGEPVRFAPSSPGCSNPVSKGSMAYEFKLSEGECLYVFDTQDGRLGRLTMIGYKGVLLRSPI